MALRPAGLWKSVVSQCLAGDFAGGDEVGGGILDRLVISENFGLRFVVGAIVRFFSGINDGDHETFGFDLRGSSGSKFDIHDLFRFASDFSAARDGLSRFFVGGFATLSLALVPSLLTLGQSDLYFHPAVAKIQARRDQRQPLLMRLTDQLVQLGTVNQELSGAQRFMVEDVAMVVFADVSVDEPEFVRLSPGRKRLSGWRVHCG